MAPVEEVLFMNISASQTISQSSSFEMIVRHSAQRVINMDETKSEIRSTLDSIHKFIERAEKISSASSKRTREIEDTRALLIKLREVLESTSATFRVLQDKAKRGISNSLVYLDALSGHTNETLNQYERLEELLRALDKSSEEAKLAFAEAKEQHTEAAASAKEMQNAVQQLEENEKMLDRAIEEICSEYEQQRRGNELLNEPVRQYEARLQEIEEECIRTKQVEKVEEEQFCETKRLANTEVSNLSQQLHNLELDTKAIDEHYSSILEVIDSTERDINTLESEKEQRSAQNETLQCHISNQTYCAEMLESEIFRKENCISELKQNIECKAARHSERSESASQITAKLEKLTSISLESEQQLEAFPREHNLLREQISGLQQDIENIKIVPKINADTLAASTATLEDMKQKLKLHNESALAAEEIVSKLLASSSNPTNGPMVAGSSKFSTAVSAFVDEVTMMVNEMSDTDKHLSQLEAELSCTNNQIEIETDKQNERASDLENEIKAIKVSIKSYAIESARLLEAKNRSHEQIQKCKVSLEHHARDLQDLKQLKVNRIKEREHQQEEASAKIDAMEKLHAQRVSELSALIAQELDEKRKQTIADALGLLKEESESRLKLLKVQHEETDERALASLSQQLSTRRDQIERYTKLLAEHKSKNVEIVKQQSKANDACNAANSIFSKTAPTPRSVFNAASRARADRLRRSVTASKSPKRVFSLTQPLDAAAVCSSDGAGAVNPITMPSKTSDQSEKCQVLPSTYSKSPYVCKIKETFGSHGKGLLGAEQPIDKPGYSKGEATVTRVKTRVGIPKWGLPKEIGINDGRLSTKIRMSQPQGVSCLEKPQSRFCIGEKEHIYRATAPSGDSLDLFG